MCIVAIAWHCFNQGDFPQSRFNQPLSQNKINNHILPVVLLSNRDEFFSRETLTTHLWQNLTSKLSKSNVRILAGKDEQSGGTWLGVNPDNKRWATVLNYREAGKNAKKPKNAISRGHLVRDFLMSDTSPMQYANQINLQQYEGFNFICGTTQQAVMVSNRGQAPQALTSGLHVFSNGGMQSHWEKTERLRMRVRQEFLPLLQMSLAQADILHSGTIKPNIQQKKHIEVIKKIVPISELDDWQKNAFACLYDTTLVANNALPDTGVPMVLEKALSAIFIDDISFGEPKQTNTKHYGTRTSTLMALDQHQPSMLFVRNFTSDKKANQQQLTQFLF